MTKKIFHSILVVSMVVLLASIAIATSFIYEYFNESQVRQLKAELSLVEETVNEEGIEYFENFNSSAFRFTVVDEEGKVLYDTGANPYEMENHSEREEILEALRDGKGSSARYSSTLTEKTFYEAVLLDNGDVLRISVSQLTVGALIMGMLPGVFFIVMIAAVLAFLLAHSMSKKVTEPLMSIDLEEPLEYTYEELEPVLNKIRKQHKQIKQQMEALRRKTDEFEHTISAMNEGFVLLDECGMVLSMNDSAREVFSAMKDVNGRDFLVMERTSNMNKAIWDALDGKHSEFRDQRNGREYQFTINPVKSDGKILGAVILAFDITERAFAEQNRREFTANVTHELKTPLQSIIGSAELLENGFVKTEDTGRFVGNIRKEATRLVSLINDIIHLSQLDENYAPATETVELQDIVAEVTQALSMPALKKNVKLIKEVEPSKIYGVRSYIYEIIYNLCDNAIRYNVDGGSVKVSVKCSEGQSIVCVEDTGIGISPEHQPRIFERFYRVDKSHSKETGGTGLGLAIVKHSVAYHNATISLESEEGKGTRITVTFGT